jgi:hypothetical protein
VVAFDLCSGLYKFTKRNHDPSCSYSGTVDNHSADGPL